MIAEELVELLLPERADEFVSGSEVGAGGSEIAIGSVARGGLVGERSEGAGVWIGMGIGVCVAGGVTSKGCVGSGVTEGDSVGMGVTSGDCVGMRVTNGGCVVMGVTRGVTLGN